MAQNLEKLVIAGFETGLQTDVKPFLLNNEAFPLLFNAYAWRKRVVKKLGTEKIGRLRRQLTTSSIGTITSPGAGDVTVNLITALGLNATQPNASIELGSITNISIAIAAPISQTLTDTTGTGTLTIVGAGPITAATLNYATGVLTLTFSGAAGPASATFSGAYYPSLPSLGDEEYNYEKTSTNPINNPDNVYFDQRYAYTFNFSNRTFIDASFYKMAAPRNPVVWNGQDYQQFYSISYQNALFVSNNNPGFHFLDVTYNAGSGTATITFDFASGGVAFTSLVVNDMLWFNGWAGGSTINGLSGYVSATTGTPGRYVVTFAASQTVAGTGICQMLTNTIDGQDGIRYYDGNAAGSGFVNFAPPLQSSATPSYLVGARILTSFGGRMLAIGTFERNSSGVVQYFANKVRYSALGTVYYASNVSSNNILPDLQTASVSAWYDDVPGQGSFFFIESPEKILTAAYNQEVLIIGLETVKKKLIATADPLQPFVLQDLSPEYGDESTFAVIPLDRGVLTVGDYGYTMTTSYNSQRFDYKIPDQIYQIKQDNNSNERVTGIRDYRNGWVYFSYPNYGNNDNFPNQTLLFNYVENNFAIFKENYTTYGYFREQSNLTWATLPYRTWRSWVGTWASAKLASRYPFIAGGNQQGYIMKRDIGTSNDYSQYIQSLSGTTVVSPNHNLVQGDFIYIGNCIGSTNLNDTTVRIVSVTDNDTFEINQTATGTYLGGGEYSLVDNFKIRTKQFPLGWGEGRSLRSGTQKYLFDTTEDGEVTLNLYTSQSDDYIANNPATTGSLIISQTVRTRPDTSLGLYDNVAVQNQIWHRLPSSFVGDTIQFEFTFSNDQMESVDIADSSVVLHAIVAEFYTRSKVLA